MDTTIFCFFVVVKKYYRYNKSRIFYRYPNNTLKN